MASMFKRNVLAQVPPGARVAEEDGRRCARWTDDGGKAQRRPVVTTRAGDKVVLRESTHWYGKVAAGKGRWRTVRLYTDKTASQRRVAELQRLADRRDAGAVTAEVERL